MLLAVGGESRRIILGEVPPVKPEQVQEPAQDVAAQWLQERPQKRPQERLEERVQERPPVPRPRTKRQSANRKSHRRRISIVAADYHNEIQTDEKGAKTAWRCAESSNESAHTTANVSRPRKLIPVDFDLKLDADDDDDDLDDEFEMSKLSDEEDENDQPSGIDDEDENDSANPWRRTGGLRLTKNEYHRFCDAQLEFYDLATQCPSRRASVRKHAAARGSLTLTDGIAGTASLPHSRPQSRQCTNIQANSSSSSNNQSRNQQLRNRPTPRPRELSTDKDEKVNFESTSDTDKITNKNLLADMFLDERLSLTLEEIVHIRSVLTKAELESLPVEGRVKEDVEKRRVCFLCLKTRFSILGPWGQRCKLCERTVCVKCYAKMRIPTEHFAHVPVVLLSPGLLSPSSSDADSGQKNQWSKSSVGVTGSAPASPASRRKPMSSTTPQSTPGTISASMEKKSYGSPSKLANTATFGINPEQRLATDRLRGVSMVVCHDCRIMVLQIIKSSRTTRATIRNNVISRLTLNLTPTYI